ncbi:glycosyltransferase [Halobacillus trueperi]|uniref:glycosyltransferase n=1 Tax=Halobacillus trueperi TaxID=156205 RepID=UPI003735D6EB
MKDVLIASYDMEVGGVERSLISLLNNFDYEQYKVDLMLYSHTGDFMDLLPTSPRLVDEMKPYKTFRMSILQTMKSGQVLIGLMRLLAKYRASRHRSEENGYKQMQYIWKLLIPYLPKFEKTYDVAISYLWPHYFVAEKVNAKTKIAWIHTDFSTVDTDEKLDIEMWDHFDYIVAVSVDCKNTFIKKYPSLATKVVVIENITSPDLVRELAEEREENPLITDKRFKLVTVARLSHAKGIDQAIVALKLLKERGYKDIVWYVVGYGGDEEHMRRLIKEHELAEDFILLGKKVNPYPFIKAADLYVQPSRYEGKAVTVTEAQILSKPVLITKYPTSGSQVKDRVDGIICEKSSEGLADGIEKLYLHPSTINQLSSHCEKKDFSNHEELKKLYDLV